MRGSRFAVSSCWSNGAVRYVGSRSGRPAAQSEVAEQRHCPGDRSGFRASGNSLLITDRTLAQIGAAHGCSPAAVALAWAVRSGNVIAIPEAGAPAHVKENAMALSLTLTPQEFQTLDAAFPGPSGPN